MAYKVGSVDFGDEQNFKTLLESTKPAELSGLMDKHGVSPGEMTNAYNAAYGQKITTGQGIDYLYSDVPKEVPGTPGMSNVINPTAAKTISDAAAKNKTFVPNVKPVVDPVGPVVPPIVPPVVPPIVPPVVPGILDDPGKFNPGTATPSKTTTQDPIDTVTLGDIEPYTQTQYNKPTTYSPGLTGTVAGQLPGILSSGSPYMQAAELKGKQYASSRGLLNSSMGAEAAQKAAIEAALPIAQQDAQTYAQAGLLGQEGEQAGALTNLEGEASSKLSAQGAFQDQEKIALQAEATAKLSQQNAIQAETMAGIEQAGANFMEALKQTGATDIETIQQTGANYRQQVGLEMDKVIAIMNISDSEKAAIANSMNTLGQNFQTSLVSIQTNPNATPESKKELLNQLMGTSQANVASLGSIYGVEIYWPSNLVVPPIDPNAPVDIPPPTDYTKLNIPSTGAGDGGGP